MGTTYTLQHSLKAIYKLTKDIVEPLAHACGSDYGEKRGDRVQSGARLFSGLLTKSGLQLPGGKERLRDPKPQEERPC